MFVFKICMDCMVVNFCGDQIFMDFVRSIIHEVLYAWCLKGHCTEKMKRLNMIGIKLVKHHNILLKRLPTQIASYSTLKLLDTPPFR